MKRWKYTIVLLLTVLVGGCSSAANNNMEAEITISPNEQKYQKAEECFKNGNYEDAKIYYEELDGYEDSGIKRKECVIAIANQLKDSGDYQGAIDYLADAKEYSEASNIISVCYLELGKQNYQDEDYEKAKECLSLSREKEAIELLSDCDYQTAVNYYKKGKYKKAKKIFRELKAYKQSKLYIEKCNAKIQAESEFLEIQYAVNQSDEDIDGNLYKNGNGILAFNTDIPLDDWVGLGGKYVTYTRPESSIHFRLVNVGKETIINPVVKFQFDGVIVKWVDDEFEGEDYVNGISGYATVVLRLYDNLAAKGSSSDYMLNMSEAYFSNGSSGTVTITVSGDNYQARQYTIPLKLK